VRSISIFAKSMGDPYYEPTIMVHDIPQFIEQSTILLTTVSTVTTTIVKYTKTVGPTGHTQIHWCSIVKYTNK